MDPILSSSVAATVLSLIQSYLAEAGRGFAGRTGELIADKLSETPEKGKELLHLFQEQISGQKAEIDLERHEAASSGAISSQALLDHLRNALETDEVFEARVLRILAKRPEIQHLKVNINAHDTAKVTYIEHSGDVFIE